MIKASLMKQIILGICAALAASAVTLQADPITIDEDNLLSGLTASVTPGELLAGHDDVSTLTDGTAANVYFAQSGAPGFDQIVSFTLAGPANVTSIGLWITDQAVYPHDLTIYGSTSDNIIAGVSTSLDKSNYAVLLTATSPLGAPTDGHYQFTLSSAANIKSLLFDFGNLNGTGANGNVYDFINVGEIQAFGTAASVPEPSTYALMGCGLVGLFAMMRFRKLS